MAVTDRQQRKKEKRRNEIIDAAERLFYTSQRRPASMLSVTFCPCDSGVGSYYIRIDNS